MLDLTDLKDEEKFEIKMPGGEVIELTSPSAFCMKQMQVLSNKVEKKKSTEKDAGMLMDCVFKSLKSMGMKDKHQELLSFNSCIKVFHYVASEAGKKPKASAPTT